MGGPDLTNLHLLNMPPSPFTHFSQTPTLKCFEEAIGHRGCPEVFSTTRGVKKSWQSRDLKVAEVYGALDPKTPITTLFYKAIEDFKTRPELVLPYCTIDGSRISTVSSIPPIKFNNGSLEHLKGNPTTQQS